MPWPFLELSHPSGAAPPHTYTSVHVNTHSCSSTRPSAGLYNTPLVPRWLSPKPDIHACVWLPGQEFWGRDVKPWLWKSSPGAQMV